MTHPLTWSRYHSRLQIADRRTHHLVPYQPNAIQAELDAILSRPLEAVRIIGLKSRRMGFSTGIQTRFGHRAFTTRDFHAVTGTHEAKASMTLHGMVETMYQNLPAPLKPAKEIGLRGKHLAFTHRSSLRTFTAGGDGEGTERSSAAVALHCSEVAYWHEAKANMTALMSIVPDEPGTIIAIESTANGIGNEFHSRWVAAVNGSSGYTPIFFAWFQFPDYTLSAEAAEVELGDEPEWTDRERSLLDRGVKPAQLAWRRRRIRMDYNGDADVFDQEYPDSPSVAFLTSGRPFFGRDALDRIAPTPPVRRGLLEGQIVRNGSKISFVDDRDGPLRIWQTPRPGRRYIIGADTAGGVTLDEHQARPTGDGSDYCCAQVIDAETGEQAAEWHGRVDADLYGDELARLGYIYATATIAVEDQGGYGLAPLASLKRVAYPSLYQRQVLDEHTGKWTLKLGWATTQTTRPVMLDTLRAWIRERPDAIRDEQTVGECRTFVTRRNGQPGADSGCHDDRVMALGVAHEVRREGLPVRVNRPKTKRKRPVFAAEAAA